MVTQDIKCIRIMDEWAKVASELEGENLKEKIYDTTLFSICGEVKGKKVLDYGAGPAVIAKKMLELGAEVKVFDISKKMLNICESKLGRQSIIYTADQIPTNTFDLVLCNLVLCIVDEPEVAAIMRNIKNALSKSGTAYVGFCNPLIFDVHESVIDFRVRTGRGYAENHIYKKVKKEGGYVIEELHRPIEWYTKIFKQEGLELEAILFTPEYEADGRKVNDFVIFKLRRVD